MITKKEIKESEFDNINGIFEYIIEKVICKKEAEARELIAKMSKRQLSWFMIYLEDCPFHSDYINIAKRLAK